MSNAAGADTSGTDFSVTEISDPPPSELTFEPIEDSFVKSSDPDKNYGDNDELRVRLRNSVEIVAYIKFSVTGVGSQPQNAVLRLTVTDESVEGGTVYLAENNYLGTNTPWEEEELLWDNAPAITSDPLSSVGPVALNDVVEFNVTDAITGDGDYTFAMKSNSFDVVRYGSKDGSFAPELVISFGSGTVSTPTVASFSPTSGPVGTDVTILGDDFIGAMEVNFDGTAASTFSVESNTEIHAVVPADATTGQVQVLNEAGSGTSDDDFIVTSTPVIASFTPDNGPIGTEVTIEGLNFTGTTEAAFNGTAASEFTIDSDTQLRAIVPSEATTGAILLTNSHGTATSTEDFVITEPPTSITLVPIHDSFVRSARPTRNYADNDELRVRQPHDDFVITYLKYDVSAAGNSISSAKIRLTVLDGSEDGGSIYSVSNNYEGSNTPWTEDGLLWDNAPSLNNPALSSLPAVSEGEIVEFDVTAAITADGIYSFGILNASNDIAKYISKEGNSAPLLIIETGSSVSLLKSNEEDTELSESKVTATQTVPHKITLQQNYPNPFNIETNIEYTLPKAGEVRIDIYNMTGQLVRTLVDEFQTTGFKTISWDGRDSQRRVVSSGVYFIRMETGQQKLVRKIT
ncbi:DNRLRE domain-containing protein, partial [candidate division KSB1 bacterium]|nr:DNRLRE domain-containing protein [candidate division KSB1 bacterium]